MSETALAAATVDCGLQCTQCFTVIFYQSTFCKCSGTEAITTGLHQVMYRAFCVIWAHKEIGNINNNGK